MYTNETLVQMSHFKNASLYMYIYNVFCRSEEIYPETITHSRDGQLEITRGPINGTLKSGGPR